MGNKKKFSLDVSVTDHIKKKKNHKSKSNTNKGEGKINRIFASATCNFM